MSMRRVNGDVVLTGNAAGSGTYTSAALSSGGGVSDVLLLIHVSAATGTSPSLTASLEQSNDGTSWTAIPGGSAAALTAAGNTTCNVRVSQNYVRVTATITGTTPALTYRVAAVVFAD